jgi:hypothetical protein
MSKFSRKTACFEEKIHREEDRYAVNQREEVEEVFVLRSFFSFFFDFFDFVVTISSKTW